MPLRDRATPKPRPTTEAFHALEQEVTSLRAQVAERFELLQVKQEADKKTAGRAPEYDREFELLTLPYRAWDPGAIITAKSLADEGDLERAADLWESCLSDDRVAAAMEQRINGLEGLPVRFTGDGEDVLGAISTDFWQMMTPGDRAAMRRWGLGVGICPVYVREWVESADGRQVPVCEVWNPRFLRWRQGETFGKREWWIQTSKSQIRLADQPGRWFLFTPFSGANQRPWVDGIWYSTATWWLAKSFGIADLASFTQSHATPKWFLSPKEGAQIAPAEKAEAIRRLAALPQRSGMYVPAGFQIEQKESTSSSWQAISTEIDLANKALTVRILGTDSTTDKESSYASTSGGMQLLYGKFRTDADAESAFWHDGPLQFWYLLNFRGARKLQDRRVLDLEADPITGVYRLLDESDRRQVRRSEYGQRLRQLSEQIRGGDEVPWPTRDATPPEDMAAVAETQGKAAAALVQLSAAATANPLMGSAIAQIDLPRYLGRYFPMQAQDESGVQLQMEDGTILELAKGKTGSGWITINGTHVYATPGQKVNFKDLKATKGGQSSGKAEPQAASAGEGKGSGKGGDSAGTEAQKAPAEAKPAEKKDTAVEAKDSPAPAEKASVDKANVAIRDRKKLPKETTNLKADTPDGSPESEWKAAAKGRIDKATDAQKDAVTEYTRGAYTSIKKAQSSTEKEYAEWYRKNEDSTATTAEIKASYKQRKKEANAVESLFGSVEPSPGVVYRGLTLDKAGADRFLNEDTIQFNGITSVSRSPVAADSFARGEHGVILKISQRRAISVESESVMPSERELIMSSKTKLTVTRRYIDKKSKLLVIEATED